MRVGCGPSIMAVEIDGWQPGDRAMSWDNKTLASKWIPVALAVLAWVAAPRAPAAAQEEPVAGFEAMVEVTEVLLDVLAVDASGEIVTGLAEDDFVVEENGKPVEVTGVGFYTTRYGPDGSPLADAPGKPLGEAIPSSRYFVFFFHDQTRSGATGKYLASRQTRAKEDSLLWIEEGMLPSDWVAIVSYDRWLRVHQDFTQDRAALDQGISSAISQRDPAEDAGRRGQMLPPSGAPSLLRHLPAGKDLRKQTRTPYDAVRLVAEAAGWIVGRKNLVLFSRDFGKSDSGYVVTAPDRHRYPPMERALNDHNVAVYPIDLTPRHGDNFQGLFLNRLALDTGGLYYQNLVSFLPALAQVSEENAGYYLISYQSEHRAAEVGYQRVKVRCLEPGVKLRARKGYRFGSDD